MSRINLPGHCSSEVLQKPHARPTARDGREGTYATAALEDNNFTTTDELIRAMLTYLSRQASLCKQRSSLHCSVQIPALKRL